jgi:hypothetical protein
MFLYIAAQKKRREERKKRKVNKWMKLEKSLFSWSK